MTTEPRTEAGRALLDDMIAVPPEPVDIMGAVRLEYRETFGTRLCAIEDEAARKERERMRGRLARARHRWQHPTFAFSGDGSGRCGCVGWAATVGDMLDLLDEDEAVAITDTGEGVDRG